MEQIKEAERALRHPFKHIERVAGHSRMLREMLVADMAERGCDAVEERLGADEAVVGQHVGAVGEMLARAEANLEMQRTVVAEQGRRGDLALGRHFMPAAASRPAPAGSCAVWPARAAVEPVKGQGIAGFMRGHAGNGLYAMR